ncbi:dioxygenase [Nocardia terpenica]|uniref:Dioxygenase n=2 Tax=Nocardia terpenica TaxID=455432 RepID=A0A6G9Z4V4_9NOCA|nr:dioxygenase [Nocardia terpenica]
MGDARAYAMPVPDEIDATELPVSGAIPPALCGRYVRNGPNALPGADLSEPHHFFSGPGMLHGVRLRNGRALWYRNRWVRTQRFLDERAGRPLRTDLRSVSANTHIIEHAGRLLALVESGLPHEVTLDLNTVGPCDFGGRLTTAMTAHPRLDPRSGELHFFGYGTTAPYVTYHRLSARGELTASIGIEVPAPTMMHDFAITDRHIVWLDLPVTYAPELRGRGMPFRWNATYGARIGVMPREGRTTVRWFDIDPCYVFHLGNARDDGDRVVIDGCRYGEATFPREWRRFSGEESARPLQLPLDPGRAEAARLHRWILDLTTGRAREERLDDCNVEFPTLRGDYVGQHNRYLYAVAETPDGIAKYDLVSGVRTMYELPDCAVGEAVFVPAPDADAEDAGWLLSIVTDRDGRSSRLLVLDASDLAAPPVARVHLPRRVPTGFHGSWIPDTADPVR